MGVTLLISLTILSIQITTCNRDSKRELREANKERQDSLLELQKSKHDSLYEKYLLRKAQDAVDSSIKNANPK